MPAFDTPVFCMRAALVLALAVLCGCTSTRTVTPGATSGASANTDLAGRTVRVLLTDGRDVRAESVTILPDSTSWFNPATGELVEVATAEVVHVTERSRGRGARQGALIGGGGSLVLVTAGILLASDDWGYAEGLKPLVAFGLGGAAGLYGAVMGGGLGYLNGSETRYDLMPAVAIRPAPTAGPTAAARSVLVAE